ARIESRSRSGVAAVSISSEAPASAGRIIVLPPFPVPNLHPVAECGSKICAALVKLPARVASAQQGSRQRFPGWCVRGDPARIQRSLTVTPLPFRRVGSEWDRACARDGCRVGSLTRMTRRPQMPALSSARVMHPLIASDRIEGTLVCRLDGRQIGTVERVMINKISGQVAYAVV